MKGKSVSIAWNFLQELTPEYLESNHWYYNIRSKCSQVIQPFGWLHFLAKILVAHKDDSEQSGLIRYYNN
jgi:hypothetical protein